MVGRRSARPCAIRALRGPTCMRERRRKRSRRRSGPAARLRRRPVCSRRVLGTGRPRQVHWHVCRQRHERIFTEPRPCDPLCLHGAGCANGSIERTKRIVGYSIGARMTSDLAVNALRNAVALRGPDATIVHSDRGSQFRSRAYVRALRGAGLRGSMGRVGACADHAAMESFFSLLQKNVLDRQRRWASREELRIAIVVWIERTYHRRRRQDGLVRMTPIEFETLLQTAHAA